MYTLSYVSRIILYFISMHVYTVHENLRLIIIITYITPTANLYVSNKIMTRDQTISEHNITDA